MRVSLLAVVLNLACNWTAVRVLGLGHGGLALSTSLVALSNAAELHVMMARRVGALPPGLGATAFRSALASAAMAAACLGWMALVGWMTGGERGFPVQLLVVGTTIPIGVAVYYASGRALGIEDLRALRRIASPPWGEAGGEAAG
jgi:putative peptidoglycan lipid II flippase